MDSATIASISLQDETQTTALGRQLASLLQPGDVLLLTGVIGAGKTHLARAIIQTRLSASGRHEEVPSPTYTLVQTYDDGECEIWHADLYRVTGPEEVIELGLVEAFDTAIVLVEWPDRLGDLAPEGSLVINLEPDGPGRRANFASTAERWHRLLPVLDPAA